MSRPKKKTLVRKKQKHNMCTDDFCKDKDDHEKSTHHHHHHHSHPNHTHQHHHHHHSHQHLHHEHPGFSHNHSISIMENKKKLVHPAQNKKTFKVVKTPKDFFDNQSRNILTTDTHKKIKISFDKAGIDKVFLNNIMV